MITLAALPAAARADASHAPRWYAVLEATDASPGIDPKLLDQARQLLHDELANRPADWALELPDAPADAGKAALATYLKKHRLVGYDLHARLLAVEQAVLPPPAGHRSKVLEVTVKVTLVGAKLLDGKLALGGDGESTVDADIGESATPQDVSQAESDALADAIKTAVGDATQRLAAASPARKRK